jgi:hypothetical protein
MGHFAKVEDGIVTEVIRAEQDFIDSGDAGDPTMWVQTSYNTRNGVHFGPDNQPDGGIALRYNFAVLGGHYDAEADAFYAPAPRFKNPENPSHYLDTTTYTWKLKPEYPKPEVPVGGMDYWVWAEHRLEWLYMDENFTPDANYAHLLTEENNP